jgi:dihydroneopterin aldolase
MADVIALLGLSGTGFHGVLPEERRNGQLFTVDVRLHTDIRAAAEADELALTVDYSQVAAGVVGIIEGEPVDLVETLAERIAALCLGFEGVRAVEVAVHKPQAPVGVPFDDVIVSITRGMRE